MIATHTTNGALAWRSNDISAAALAAAGVAQTANMRVRFTANDTGTASIVEAGIDAFKVTRLSCSGLSTTAPAAHSAR